MTRAATITLSAGAGAAGSLMTAWLILGWIVAAESQRPQKRGSSVRRALDRYGA